MVKELRGVFRIFADKSLVDHRGGAGFNENDPSYNYEILFENGKPILYEDYYVHSKGSSKKRKIGDIKNIELLEVFSENELVLKVTYEENIGDWIYY